MMMPQDRSRFICFICAGVTVRAGSVLLIICDVVFKSRYVGRVETPDHLCWLAVIYRKGGIF